jgi:class 3 adenylate cyclase/tetratricopeptide (TPR) repeat protein
MSLHAPVLDPGKDEALFKYLPRTLIENWTKSPEQPPIWGQWLTGSLMHVDITGFTAMSESLARMGNEGAEFMASTLNRFFEHMLGIASEWGGVQMKFGGDAMLLLFSGTDHAAHAAACGREMQSAMRFFRKIKVVDDVCQLRMRVGIHSGKFYSASIGDPDKTLHYFLFGSDVNKAADVEPMAEPGQVVVSTETAELINGRGKCLSTKHDGIWRVTQVNTQKPVISDIDFSTAPCDMLRRYMMPPIAQGRTAGLAGEHRRTTIVFIYLIGTSELLSETGEKETLGQVDTYVKMVLTTVERYGGYLAASDVSEHGDKLIVLFGAPVSRDEQETNSVRFAYELNNRLNESALGLQHQIGINSGFVFAGEIGSSWRREYTVIGDNVNLAARLMAAAGEGNVLVSESTAKRTGDECELRRLRPIRVKGKSKPIHIYKLEGLKKTSQHLARYEDTPFVGRENEMAKLQKLSDRVMRGSCEWAYIYGEPGIGKTRLCIELAQHLRSSGWRFLHGTCRTHTTQSPFSVWIDPLRLLFGIELSDAPESAWEKIKTVVERLRPELRDFAPLVSEILGYPGEQNPVVQSLDAKSRHEKRLQIIAELFEKVSQESPVIVFLDDTQWIDSSSSELIRSLLAKKNSSLFVCLTSRQEQIPKEIMDYDPGVSLHLAVLSENASMQLVKSINDLSDNDICAIVERANGNPLFLKELASNSSDSDDVLPETIHDVIMLRMDRLGDEERNTLQLASVIGVSFDTITFTPIVSDNYTHEKTKELLRALIEHEFINKTAGDGVYVFINNLTWEVVYESLLFAKRRELHNQIADYLQIVNINSLDSISDYLLYHYELAENFSKTVTYGAMAGDKAASMYANTESIQCYQRAIDALTKVRHVSITDRSLLLERIGDVHDIAGDYSEAIDSYKMSLEQWNNKNNNQRQKLVPWSVKKRLRNTALYRKIAVCCERQSNYDDALRWLNDALTSMPERPGKAGSDVYATKSAILCRVGEYKDAIEWGKRALSRYRTSDRIKEKAYAHNVIANTYSETGRLQNAIQHFLKAIDIYDEINDLQGSASANSNLALCYLNIGNFELTLKHFEIALNKDKLMHNDINIAHDYYNLGVAFLNKGDLEKSISNHNKVIQAFEAGKCPSDLAGAALLCLCESELAKKNVLDAENYLRDGLRLVRKTGIQFFIIEGQLLLIEIQLAKGYATEAHKACERIFKKIIELDLLPLQIRAEQVLGNICTELNELNKAHDHYLNAVTLSKRIGAAHEEAKSLIALSRNIISNKGNTNKTAQRYLKRAIKISMNKSFDAELSLAKRLLH